MPYPVMDLCLYGLDNGKPAAEVAARGGLTVEQVEVVWRDISRSAARRVICTSRRCWWRRCSRRRREYAPPFGEASGRGRKMKVEAVAFPSSISPHEAGRRSHQYRRPYITISRPPRRQARAARQRCRPAPSRKQRQHLDDHLQDRAGANAEAERDPERARPPASRARRRARPAAPRADASPTKVAMRGIRFRSAAPQFRTLR